VDKADEDKSDVDNVEGFVDPVKDVELGVFVVLGICDASTVELSPNAETEADEVCNDVVAGAISFVEAEEVDSIAGVDEVDDITIGVEVLISSEVEMMEVLKNRRNLSCLCLYQQKVQTGRSKNTLTGRELLHDAEQVQQWRY